MTRKKIFVIILIFVLLLVTAIILFLLSKSRSFQFFGGMINYVDTSKSIVALTFDDGPISGNTERVLSILEKYQIPATFFVIGEEIEQHPESLKNIIASGHQVGNHSYTHQRMVLKSPHRVRYEIEKTDTLIIHAGYTGTIHFRTPYGKRLFVTPWVLRSLGKANILFDVEPETYVENDAARIKAYVLQHTTSGSIILLHPMYGGNENKALLVLEDIVIGLNSKGFQFVTIDELLQQTNTQPAFW